MGVVALGCDALVVQSILFVYGPGAVWGRKLCRKGLSFVVRTRALWALKFCRKGLSLVVGTNSVVWLLWCFYRFLFLFLATVPSGGLSFVVTA